MIFVAGIHGVGKTTFRNLVEKEIGMPCYTASQLIEKKKKENMPINKQIIDINDNQSILLECVKEIKIETSNFILEGHFCLLNEFGEIKRIKEDVFRNMKIDLIIVLVNDEEEIANRNSRRKANLLSKIDFVKEFQKQEVEYATFIAKSLNVPFFVININNVNQIIDLLRRDSI